jgi:hypothetical protein
LDCLCGITREVGDAALEEQHVLKEEVVIRFEQSLTEVTWGGLVVKSINNNLDGIVAIFYN